MEFYESLKKRDVNETRMYEDIQSFIRLALKNGYELRVCSDGYATVIEYTNPSLTNIELGWIDHSETAKKEDDDE